MKADRLAIAGSFCWNESCSGYGKVNLGNIVRYGRTEKGTQRLKCKICGNVFVENKGTVLYGLHHDQKEVLECFAMLAERNSLAAIHSIKGIKEETFVDWLRKAADHIEEIERLLVANHHLSRVQLDAMWTYVGHKGEKATILKKATEVLFGEELQ